MNLLEKLLLSIGFYLVFVGVVNFFTACLFYRFGIKIPSKNKSPIYKMEIDYCLVYYHIQKYEYKYENIVTEETFLWVLIPFSPAFRVKRYIPTKRIGIFTEKEIEELPSDFCLKEYYEKELEYRQQKINKENDRLIKLEQKVETLNQNKC